MGRSFLFSGGYTTYTTAAVDNGTVWGRVLRNCGPMRRGREETVSWAKEGGREGSDPIFTKTFFLFKPTSPSVPKHRILTGSVIIVDPHFAPRPPSVPPSHCPLMGKVRKIQRYYIRYRA